MDIASFARSHLTFAKVVTTPTSSTWSQAYNAGSLFAVLSLTKKEEQQVDLSLVGKAMLEKFEEEYFTLETKDLALVRTAIETALATIPESVTRSFGACAIIPEEPAIMYAFASGGATIFLKRAEQFATILSGNDALQAASGFLVDKDTVVVATSEFITHLPPQTLAAKLNNHPPSDVAEAITPLLHDTKEGAASCVIIAYKKPQLLDSPRVDAEQPTRIRIFIATIHTLFLPRLTWFLRGVSKLERLRHHLKHPQRVFLTIAAVLVVVLGASIFFAITKQQEAKRAELFAKSFQQAKTRFEEGQGVVSLNRQVARESFEKAKEQLIKLRENLPVDAKEQEQVKELLARVEEAVLNVSGVSRSNAVKVDPKESTLLDHERKTRNFSLFAQNETTIYFANAAEIASLTKANGKTATLIINKDLWSDAAGLGIYSQNVYLLDKKSSKVIKFVPQEKGYTNSNYFAQKVSPNLANAASMTIDTSVWILLSDGTVLKFTRGKPDAFSLSGLDTPLSNPTKIFTNTETKALYILDKGNSRVVVFEKNGAYKAQYQADVASRAKDFDVQETNKKIFLLVEDTVFAIEMQ